MMSCKATYVLTPRWCHDSILMQGDTKMTLDEIKFTLRISQEMSNRLDEIAKREDLSKNQVVRKALKKLFEEFETKEKERRKQYVSTKENT